MPYVDSASVAPQSTASEPTLQNRDDVLSSTIEAGPWDRILVAVTNELTSVDSQTCRIVSRLKQFGKDSRQGKGGVSGLDPRSAAYALVNDLNRYPHAFVLGCIADRQVKADVAWRLPHLIRDEAGDFEFKTLVELPESVWSAALKRSGHRLATMMGGLLPAAVQLIANRYGGDAKRVWAAGSSGAAVARRFLAFDGVGPKISNMAVNILIRNFGVSLAPPMPDIAVDTHVRRVFVRLGLLRPLDHSRLRSTRAKQKLRLQLRAREVNPDWPGELDWPTYHIGRKWCHARHAPNCRECRMGDICPRIGVS